MQQLIVNRETRQLWWAGPNLLPDMQARKRDLVTHHILLFIKNYDIFVSDKSMGDMIKRASNYWKTVLLHWMGRGLDMWHTQPHTTPVTTPLKAVAIQCGEAGDDFTVHTLLLLISLLFLPIYIHLQAQI